MKVGKTVVTVQAAFKDAQRRATKDAGPIAGLEVVRIINGMRGRVGERQGRGEWERKERKERRGNNITSQNPQRPRLRMEWMYRARRIYWSLIVCLSFSFLLFLSFLLTFNLNFLFLVGSGTFDVSVLKIENQVFEVVATNGATH